MVDQSSKPEFSQFSEEDVKFVAKPVFQGFFKINEYQLSHRLFNGSWSKPLTREIFERGDAVVLIPYDAERDQLVLVEQFRPGALRTSSNPWLLEFIAGMFGENESAEAVACREAKEEANLDITPNSLEPVLDYLSSPGGTSERIYIYIAPVDSRGVGGVYGLEHEGEDIRVHVVDRCHGLKLLEQGKIANAATVIGLQWLAINYQQLQHRWLSE
jgi:ADP-ribose pyrophosphatase